MRPVRIHVEGFAAYRKKVEVDFEDVEFFSLAGPTGSGKSSLIDAMVFALYGRVPRLGGNALAPAISAGGDRARVAFDFAVGEDVYTAVRMAQRTSKGGASVREARLQLGDKVIADGADDVTEAVEGLLRLRFDDFTRTVVLPQGDFARFLTATKAERQGLLRNLLGFDVYTRMRELARTRVAVAQERAESARRSIDVLDIPEPEELETARLRRDDLSRLNEAIGEDQRQLDEAIAQLKEAEAERSKLDDHMLRLNAIAEPPRLTEIETHVGKARDDVADASEKAGEAAKTLEALSAEVEAVPPMSSINMWQQQREKFAALESQIESADHTPVREMLQKAESELESARSSHKKASQATVEARDLHAAHVLLDTVEVGQPCPVCQSVVTDLPDKRPAPELAELEEAESRAARAVEEARSKLVEVKTQLAGLESRSRDLMTRRDEFAAELEAVPPLDDLAGMATKHSKLATKVSQAKREKADSEARLEAAERALEDLADDRRQLNRRFNTAQLSVAELDPPVPESDDVIVQWKELMIWRDAKLEEIRVKQERAEQAVSELAGAAESKRSAITARLDEVGVEPIQPFAVQVGAAFEAARAKVEMHEKALAEGKRLAEEVSSAESDVAVADTLAGHLRSNGFEQWLMAGALNDLVAGANQLLDQLSGGGYSLQSDDAGAFSIVDHRNADETRPVATLSGGETFLVSMALALSLAETLAAKGGSGLDAIILDEGFGTLDDETLDTVAAVLEELAGSGLMVGVITHVKDLAARAPVRYEVSRQPDGACVVVTS